MSREPFKSVSIYLNQPQEELTLLKVLHSHAALEGMDLVNASEAQRKNARELNLDTDHDVISIYLNRDNVVEVIVSSLQQRDGTVIISFFAGKDAERARDSAERLLEALASRWALSAR